MKRIVMTIALIFSAILVNAQFYISGTGGIAANAGEKVLGQKTSLTSLGELSIEDLEATYGNGVQTQIRGGYFFNEKIGIELGIGYLYGFDQQNSLTTGISNQPEVNIIARGRHLGLLYLVFTILQIGFMEN